MEVEITDLIHSHFLFCGTNRRNPELKLRVTKIQWSSPWKVALTRLSIKTLLLLDRFLCWVAPLQLKLMMLYLHPLNENLWKCLQALVFFSRDESDSNIECSVGRTHYAQSLQVTPIRYARFLTIRWKGHINVTTNKFCQLEKSYCH